MVSSKHETYIFMHLITIVHLQQKIIIKCLGIATNIFDNAKKALSSKKI